MRYNNTISTFASSYSSTVTSGRWALSLRVPRSLGHGPEERRQRQQQQLHLLLLRGAQHPLQADLREPRQARGRVLVQQGSHRGTDDAGGELDAVSPTDARRSLTGNLAVHLLFKACFGCGLDELFP